MSLCSTEKKEARITVLSCGIERNTELEKIDFSAFNSIYASSSLIKQYLKEYADDFPEKIYVINANARKLTEDILEKVKKQEKILVLCSGDALFHGFGGTLCEKIKNELPNESIKEYITFTPNITAFQALFHKIGLSWSNVSLFSVHNTSSQQMLQITNSELPLIYGGTAFPAHIIAKNIIEYNKNYEEKKAIAAELLGSDKERIVNARLKEIALDTFSPTSLLLIPNNEEIAKKNILPLGLEEDFYSKENNLITASDVRAVILSRLKLPTFGILWDLGAGSGSVGLEAAALCPHLEVHSVEKNKSRIQHIEENKKKLGVSNYTSHHRDILDFLNDESVRNPDRIFIGGGGKDILKIVHLAKKILNKDGILIISAVTLETFSTLFAWKKEEKNVHIIKIDIAKEESIAKEYTSFKQNNPLFLFIYSNKESI